ncbi:phosphatase PAP2 family protein [bacterium]|nr:phosphatase PAP2 family protein [bacterium]
MTKNRFISRLGKYSDGIHSLTDRVILAYLLLIGLLLIPFHQGIQYWPWISLTHCMLAWGLAESLCIMNRRPNRWSESFQLLYPLIFVFVSWMELKVLITMIFPDYYGTLIVQQLEHGIFNTYPTAWMERWYTPWLTESMHAFYSFYYLLLPGSVIVPFLIGEKKTARTMAFIITLNHVLFILLFLLFPVEGPKTALHAAQDFRQDGLFFMHLIHSIQRGASIKGAAFPSLHVAESFCISWVMLKKHKKTGLFLILFSCIMSVATVYCQYHYAVDTLAALLFSLPVCILGRHLLNNHNNPNGMRPKTENFS